MTKFNNPKIEQTSSNSPWLIVLTVILAVLKVTEVINVSWWIVFMPLWLPFAIILGLFVLFGLGFAVVYGGAWVLDLISKLRK